MEMCLDFKDIQRQVQDQKTYKAYLINLFPILKLLKIKKHILPKVKDCADDYGYTHPSITGKSIPITGVVGDQQSATIGQCCFEPGSLKSTYGTGAFILLNTGSRKIYSKNRLLTTIAYRLNGKTNYTPSAW